MPRQLIAQLALPLSTLMFGACASSGSDLSRTLAPSMLGKPVKVIVLPARSVPVQFRKSKAKGDVEGSPGVFGTFPGMTEEAALGAGVLNLASLEWGVISWDESPETLPTFNVGRAVSEACLDVLVEHVAAVSSAHIGPDWKLTPGDLKNIYAGTHEETRFSHNQHVPHGRYTGEGPITHGAEWVKSRFAGQVSANEETWLLEPLVVYAVIAPTGFTLQSFFHLYDVRTGEVLAQKYPNSTDVNFNVQPIGTHVVDEAGAGDRYSIITTKAVLGLVSKNEKRLRITDEEILEALDRASRAVAIQGLIDLGLIRAE